MQTQAKPKNKAILKPVDIPLSKLEKIWAQVPADYYDHGIKNNLLQKFWHTKKLSQVIKFLPQTESTLKVLDIGCSSGILTNEVAKKVQKGKITGLDSYKKAITFAKSKYPQINFVVGDAHAVPFPNRSFDIVICTETLEHVTDPKKALLEIKRVLKKDGAAIISMDSGSVSFKLIWYFWTKSKGKVWQDAHLHEFNAQILEKLIKQAGFKIKRKEKSHAGMAITFLAVPK